MIRERLRRLRDDITYAYNVDRRRWRAYAVLGTCVSYIGYTMWQAERSRVVEPGAPQQAWVQLGLMVLSIGLSILAGRLLAKKSDSPIRDDKPTTLSTRGSFIPWVQGIRRIGPVICWAGDREARSEKVKGGGGKGGDDPEQDIFYEAGWHVLGVGPMFCLHRIIQGGKTIFNGPISADSHPSGTTVDLGKEGSFSIYWGEPTQPTNGFLGNANRVTVTSRWPHTCYIVWNKKRLSSTPVWPILDYVVQRRPSTSVLSQSDSWYTPGTTLSGSSFSVDDCLSSAVENTGYLEFSGDRTSSFKPKRMFALTGNGLPDADYEVLRSSTVQIPGPTTPNGFPTSTTATRVFLQGGTLGCDDQGSAELYTNDNTEGANIAHVIAELLFADFPLGLQIDPDHLVEKWDLASLEVLGVEAETEGWRASVLGSEGETAEALLAAMLQDHGTMLPIDPTTGNLLFQRVRFPVGTLKDLGEDIYADKLPEIETRHDAQPVDRLIFTFNDRAKEFGDMTISIDEDGQASYEQHQRARKVPMVSTVQFETAASLAELRSPEELAPGAEFRLSAAREARELTPGEAIIADGFEEVLRVTGVSIDPLSERVSVNVMPDFYGAAKSTFETGDGKNPPTVLDPELDEAFVWVEIPGQKLGSFPQEQVLLIPHIRNHLLITGAVIHLSRDDVTYTVNTTDATFQTGGQLNAPLAADGPNYLAQGPEYTELGPDNSTLTQDLSADLTNWGLGRQLAVIHEDAVGTEICFLQRATVTGGSTRRLDGLLRARYDTRQLSFSTAAVVYIFDQDVATPITDILLEPEEDLYVKTQPQTTTGSVQLSAVPPYGEELVGKGQVPVKPDYVYCKAPFTNSPAFQSGDAIRIAWALSSAVSTATGAGFQSSGQSIASPALAGTVTIELLTTGDVVQETIGVDANDGDSYLITNAALVAAFTSEPAAFKVRVTHTANGHASDVSPSLTITRVA